MTNHKVVDIKITYEPENMKEGEEVGLEEKIEAFLKDVQGTKGVKVKAKRHNVAVDVMLDEYGIEID